jgi:hypothetical protein
LVWLKRTAAAARVLQARVRWQCRHFPCLSW